MHSARRAVFSANFGATFTAAFALHERFMDEALERRHNPMRPYRSQESNEREKAAAQAKRDRRRARNRRLLETA